MEDGMTIEELIKYLKTLKQDYKIELGDSEYPNSNLSKESFTESPETTTYVIY